MTMTRLSHFQNAKTGRTLCGLSHTSGAIVGIDPDAHLYPDCQACFDRWPRYYDSLIKEALDRIIEMGENLPKGTNAGPFHSPGEWEDDDTR